MTRIRQYAKPHKRQAPSSKRQAPQAPSAKSAKLDIANAKSKHYRPKVVRLLELMDAYLDLQDKTDAEYREFEALYKGTPMWDDLFFSDFTTLSTDWDNLYDEVQELYLSLEWIDRRHLEATAGGRIALAWAKDIDTSLMIEVAEDARRM